MKRCLERLYNGIIKENPTFVQMLGMCPTLAVTSSAINGLGMGLATLAVLTMSNMIISMLRNVISDRVRIPAYITIIASFVTIVSFIMQAYTPELYESLGVFISLIVVNCIILGRAEAYAGKNPVLPSIFDGIGMGLGFTLGLTVIGIIREFIGAGTFFGMTVTADLWEPIRIFTMNPGAFFVLAFIVAFINAMAMRKAAKKGEKPEIRRIDGCAGCTNLSCAGRNVDSEKAAEIMKAAAEKRAETERQV
ncbi:electron transport complex protein RnfE [Eubacterium ruminantium]|nr:electron transport complex protein RnfE [Eubacterium ruminantium]